MKQEPVVRCSLKSVSWEVLDFDEQQTKKTGTKGACRCGYKHELDGKEYDFIIDVTGFKPIGFDIDSNPEETVLAWLDKQKLDVTKNASLYNQLVECIRTNQVQRRMELGMNDTKIHNPYADDDQTASPDTTTSRKHAPKPAKSNSQEETKVISQEKVNFQNDRREMEAERKLQRERQAQKSSQKTYTNTPVTSQPQVSSVKTINDIAKPQPNGNGMPQMPPGLPEMPPGGDDTARLMALMRMLAIQRKQAQIDAGVNVDKDAEEEEKTEPKGEKLGGSDYIKVETTIEPQELVVDKSKPTTRIRVRSIGGATAVVEINLEHTVANLYNHVAFTNFYLMLPPNNTLTDMDITIDAAKLKQAAVNQCTLG